MQNGAGGRLVTLVFFGLIKGFYSMERIIKDQTADPAALGLFGFAMTTILLNIHNAGFYPVSVMIMGMGIFYGGIAQVIAGIMEWKKGNLFGMVAFTSFGMFWLSLIFVWICGQIGLPAADSTSMACYLALWGLFTAVLFIATFKGHTVGKLLFGTLVILFFLLALATLTESEELHRIAGLEGILCGSIAFYEAAATVINSRFGRKILPL